MSKLSFATLDVVKLHCPTIAGIEHLMEEKAADRLPPWGYQLAAGRAPYAYGTGVTLSAVLEGLKSTGSTVGDANSAEVLENLWQATRDRKLSNRRFELRDRKIELRKGIYINAPVTHVSFSIPGSFGVIFQPRKGYRLTSDEQAYLFGICRIALDHAGYIKSDLELFDDSTNEQTGERQTRIVTSQQAAVMSTNETLERLEMYAEALDRCRRKGIQRPKREVRQQRESADTAQMGLNL